MSGIVLVVLIALATPVVALIALFKARSNENQIWNLTREVSLLRAQLAATNAPADAQASPEPTGESPQSEPAPDLNAAFNKLEAERLVAQAHAREEEQLRAAAPHFSDGRSSTDFLGDLENSLTSRWMVWLGGAAIALGGVFLVKYAIDKELLGPGVRVTLGVLMGGALAGLGEWLRRRPLQQAIAAVRPNHVPPALTASGIFMMFASIYAAYGLYHLLSPVIAFALLAVVAFAAVALSLLQGMFVALLGIFCGFLTPALVASDAPSAWTLFSYLLVVECACLAVVRYRGWWWLAFATLAGVAIWPFLWLVMGAWTLADALPLGLYLLASASAFFLMRSGMALPQASDSLIEDISHSSLPQRAGNIAALVMAVTLVAVTNAADHNITSLILFGVSIALYMGVGRYDASLERLPIISALATLAIFATMPLPSEYVPPEFHDLHAPLIPQALGIFTVTGVAYGALFAFGGFAVLWGAKRPGIWAGVSALMPVLLLAIAYWRVVDFATAPAWAVIAAILAGANLFAAERIERYRAVRGLDVSMGLYAAGVVACLSLAVGMILREAWLTVALSIQLPALAYIRQRIPVRALEILAGIIAALVLDRLVFNYNVLGYPLTGVPIFNWVLYGYGIPALAFFGAAQLFRKSGAQNHLVTALEAGALAFLVLLVSLQLRLFITGGIAVQEYGLLETSLQSIAWLSIGAALAVLDTVRSNKVTYYGARLLLGLAAAQIIFVQLLVSNPLWAGGSVQGILLVDVLLLAYAVPAVFAFWFSNVMGARTDLRHLTHAVDAAGYLLVFTYLSLEVRRAFHGPVLFGGTVSDGEMYTYSLVWLAYAAVLLGIGIVTRQSAVRYASLAVLALTSLKVFLFDMGSLTGLFRAASFIGLGLSLIGIGYLYQRFVLTKPPAA